MYVWLLLLCLIFKLICVITHCRFYVVFLQVNTHSTQFMGIWMLPILSYYEYCYHGLSSTYFWGNTWVLGVCFTLVMPVFSFGKQYQIAFQSDCTTLFTSCIWEFHVFHILSLLYLSLYHFSDSVGNIILSGISFIFALLLTELGTFLYIYLPSEQPLLWIFFAIPPSLFFFWGKLSF